MVVEKIKYDESLRSGTDKLNASIEQSNSAISEAGVAKNTANQAVSTSQEAVTKAESIQEQFNQVVIEGDSSVEAAQARVDAKNVAQPTLKARLDKDYNEVTAQLAEKLNKGNVDINDFNDATRQTFLDAQSIDVNVVLGKENVRPANTTFLTTGKNLFDVTKIKPNFMTVDGTVATTSTYFHTDYIPVKNGQSVIAIGSNGGGRTIRYATFFDINYNVLPQYGINNSTSHQNAITANGAEIEYAILSFSNAYIANDLGLMVEYGTVSTTYEPYKLIPINALNLSSAQKEEILSMFSVENTLKGKTLLATGDSIVRGNENGDISFIDLIVQRNEMTAYKYAIGGATIAPVSGKSHIIDQFNQAKTDGVNPDFIIFDGGTNDAIQDRTVLGVISEGYTATLDTTTFCGSFEHLCKTIKLDWMGVPIFYVRVHNMGSRDAILQKTYGDKAVEICKKWGIIVIDLYNDSGLNTNIPEYATTYTVNGDKTHPNTIGYAIFYVSLIEAKLKAA